MRKPAGMSYLMSSQRGFLSDADPVQPFDELSAWRFCGKSAGTSHLMSSQRGFLSDADPGLRHNPENPETL